MSKLLAFLAAGAIASGAELPARYIKFMEEGAAQVEKRLSAEPAATLASLESAPGWKHFPSMVLVAAVLHKTDLALRIGDLLCSEAEKGRYNTRLDHHRDTYMWLDAYRLLEAGMEPARRARWRKALEGELTPLAADVAKRQDYPRYASPFIGTSPNHYSLWSSTVFLGGKVFHNAEWERLGAKVMHRFAAEEQAPDGYWGEHTRAGPTTNYDYLTATGVALYYEHSHDEAALRAIRRSLDFHKYFTYTDGMPVETVNDRNRYGYISMWCHFGYSHFPDGRRYAEFLTARYPDSRISLEMLGRMAQDVLYWHEGPSAPIPQDEAAFVHRLQIPAGMRKAGPWMVCLSGLMATQAPANQFYLDRQAHISIFNDKLGLIVTGANSKRQPELATFFEDVGGQRYHMPMSTRLEMGGATDKLALAYSTFFAVLDVATTSEGVSVRAAITPKGRAATQQQFHLQLCLNPGEALETGAGRRITVGRDSIELSPSAIGGSIRHHGWILTPDSGATLRWPVYPFNPYSNAPEQGLEHAVAVLSGTSIELKQQ